MTTPDPMSPADVEGLLAKLQKRQRIIAGRGKTTERLRNPDGPEAAALIERLTADGERMREAADAAFCVLDAEQYPNVVKKLRAALSPGDSHGQV